MMSINDSHCGEEEGEEKGAPGVTEGGPDEEGRRKNMGIFA